MELRRKISLKKKEQLKKDISNLGYNEHCEIYNIIRKDTDKISENSNGIFINLKFIKDETLFRVEDFVHYCKNTRQSTRKIEAPTISSVEESVNTKNNIEDSLLSDENLLTGFHNFENSIFKNAKLNLLHLIDDSNTNLQSPVNACPVPPRKSSLPRSKKLRLNGVRERILKKCRNMNKDLFFCDSSASVKDTDEDLSQLDFVSVSSVETISTIISTY